VVTSPNVHFSLLTERLVRMEYSPSEKFEDHPWICRGRDQGRMPIVSKLASLILLRT
jgi:hypothetical protein